MLELDEIGAEEHSAAAVPHRDLPRRARSFLLSEVPPIGRVMLQNETRSHERRLTVKVIFPTASYHSPFSDSKSNIIWGVHVVSFPRPSSPSRWGRLWIERRVLLLLLRVLQCLLLIILVICLQ